MPTCSLCGQDAEVVDSHHSTPREFGGHDSPQLDLCPTCHQTIHRCARNPARVDSFLSRLRPSRRKVAAWLIEQAKGTPDWNKDQVTVSFVLPGLVHQRLKILAKDFGKPLSQLIVDILSEVVGCSKRSKTE